MTLLIEHSHILFFRYISLARTRYGEIIEQHEAITSALGRIYKENELAAKLHKQLEHEKIVLEERIAVSGVFNQWEITGVCEVYGSRGIAMHPVNSNGQKANIQEPLNY